MLISNPMWARIKFAFWFLAFGGLNLALVFQVVRRGSFTLKVGRPPNQTVAALYTAAQHPLPFWITAGALLSLGAGTVVVGLILLARREPLSLITPSAQLTRFGKFLLAYAFAVILLFTAGAMYLSTQHR